MSLKDISDIEEVRRRGKFINKYKGDPVREELISN